MIYSFSSINRGSKFLDIEFTIEKNKSSEVYVQLPAWRPGRYELANFAKNIQKFEVRTLQNKYLKFEKVTKDKWKIYTENENQFKIKYNYYANELNAGSTWVDENQIYVNPVNCCFYVEGRENEPVKLFLKKSGHKQVATSLKKNGDYYNAESFDELADSPFILSDSLQHNSYRIKGVKFNLWFQGECRLPWKKIIKDFKAFTKTQVEVFGSFPFEEYHFIYQILPFKAYHGVEHLKSTVISFGPGYSVFEEKNYEEFLGVSSHELFHAWNVKSIRPTDMLPYDFSKENYTRMGHLTEGVTTYYGDLMLKRSKVFTNEQYLNQINKTLDRHFRNYGTQNLSVSDSSFDTWLDGYTKGIPNRKGSIYTEGSLVALIVDLKIRTKSKGKKSLDTVMKALFIKKAKQRKGITNDYFKESIEMAAGAPLPDLWNTLFIGKENYFKILKDSLIPFEIKIKKSLNSDFLAARYGFYSYLETSKALFIAPNSPASDAGLNVNDEILAVNGIKVQKNNAKNWVKHFGRDIKLTIKKDELIKTVQLSASTKAFFPKVRLILPSDKHNKLLKNWLGE